MRLSCTAALLCISLFSLMILPPVDADTSQRGRYEILLRSLSFTPDPGMGDLDGEALKERGEQALFRGRTRIHALVQLYDIPTAHQRERLAEEGVDLLAYLPNYAWLASIPADDPERVVDLPGVRWAGALQAEDKLHPLLSDGDLGKWAYDEATNRGIFLVLLHGDVTLQEGRELLEADGVEVTGEVGLINALVVEADADRLQELAREDVVEWIEQPLPPLEGMSNKTRANVGADKLQAAPYNLDGEHIDVLVYDQGRAYKHPDLSSRMAYGDTAPFSVHSTLVAGIIGGDGAINKTYTGIAPKADLLSMGFNATKKGVFFYTNSGDIQKDMSYAKNTWPKSAELANMSLALNVAYMKLPCSYEGNYGATSKLLDAIVRGTPGVGEPFIITAAVGREHYFPGCSWSFGKVPPPAGAKNPIQSGATDATDDSIIMYTSWGPTDDGRLKPIVCAPGYKVTSCYNATAYGTTSGSSMSSAATAGIVALMLQQYGGSDEFLPSTAKALLIHTAVDLWLTGPDYKYGYGRIDGVKAVEAVTAADFREEKMTTHGEVHEYTIDVKPGTKELRASLAWDDPPASLVAIKKLVNDLDLELEDPGKAIHYPWVLDPNNPAKPAAKGVDNLNNQEQVVVSSPQAGKWKIRVKASLLPKGPQAYSIVFPKAGGTAPAKAQGAAPSPTPTPDDCDEALKNGDFEMGGASWTWSGSAGAFGGAVHSGSQAARLGGTSSGGFYQEIAIPGNATGGTLTFWVRMETKEPGAYKDFLDVEILDAKGKTLANLLSLCEINTAYKDHWVQETFQLGSAYAGMTIRISFQAKVNNMYDTYWYIDDAGLEICTSGPSPTPTTTSPPTLTPTITQTPTPTPTWDTSVPTHTPTGTPRAWPMFRHDRQRTGRSTHRGATDPVLKWSYYYPGYDGYIDTSAVVGPHERIYAGTLGADIFSLNSDGSFYWSFTKASKWVSSPAVDENGTVYFGSGDNNLYCLTGTGALSWSYPTGKSISSSPVIGRDTAVYFGSGDRRAYSVNSTGSLRWSYLTDDSVMSSPALGTDGKVYVGSQVNDQTLYCLGSDGSLLWTFWSGGLFECAPALGKDGRIYTGSLDQNLYRVNSDGSFTWSYKLGGKIRSSPAIGPKGNVCISAGDNKVYNFTASGTLSWSYRAGTAFDGFRSSPSMDADGKVYVGSLNSPLFCLNSGGTLSWSYVTGGPIRNEPTIGSGGTIYVGSQDKHVYAIKQVPTPTPFTPHLPKLRYGPPRVWINDLLPPGPWGPIWPGPPDPEPYLQPGLFEELKMKRAAREEILASEEDPAIRLALEPEIRVLELGMEIAEALQAGDDDRAGALGWEVLVIAIEMHLNTLESELAASEDGAEREYLGLEIELYNLDIAFIRAEAAGDWEYADELIRRIGELETRWEAAADQ